MADVQEPANMIADEQNVYEEVGTNDPPDDQLEPLKNARAPPPDGNPLPVGPEPMMLPPVVTLATIQYVMPAVKVGVDPIKVPGNPPESV